MVVGVAIRRSKGALLARTYVPSVHFGAQRNITMKRRALTAELSGIACREGQTRT